MRSSSRFVWPVLAVALVIGACSDSVTSNGNGRLTIQLTDAPAGDLKEANVVIEKIILLRSGTDSSSRVTITPDVTGPIDLLKLTGGKLLEIVSAESVPEGSYSEMRVVVDEAYVKLNDGRVFATAGATVPSGTTVSGTLKCPSCSSSGYKVKFSSGGLNIQGNSTIVLDFDAGGSFGHEAGQSGQWIMHPVLRATATTIRFANISGNVGLATGVTIPACGGQANTLTSFKPRAIAAPDTLTGSVDVAGAYKISGVLPGTYAVSFAKDVTFTNGDSLTFTATPSVSSVTVAQGDSAKANYSVTAVSCH